MKKTIFFLIATVLTAHVSAQKAAIDVEKQEAIKVATTLADSLRERKNALPVLKSLAAKDFIERHIDDSTNYALGVVGRDLAKSLSHEELWRYYALTLSFDYYKASYAATLGYFGPPEEGADDEGGH